MTAIWHRAEAGWGKLAPIPFDAEKTLHDLVEEAPQMLPLSGSPGLEIVGREVQLGGNYADLIAIEPAGRLAIIEIKLASNAEARRAVIAQVLTYAAFLDHMDVDTLEHRILAKHLEKRGFSTLAAAAANKGSDAYDQDTFLETLSQNLREGRFRLVLVLDSAPQELTRLVGYLEKRSNGLVIDLVTVSEYTVGNERVLVPQRIDPERRPADVPEVQLGEVAATAGPDEFIATLTNLWAPARENAMHLVAWAQQLLRPCSAYSYPLIRALLSSSEPQATWDWPRFEPSSNVAHRTP
jgi:hypothetical protein